MNSTNRFDLLKKEHSVFKNVKNTKNNHYEQIENSFKTNRFVSKQINEEREKKQKNEQFAKSLENLTEFPELSNKKTKKDNLSVDNSKNKQNFIDIIKSNKNTVNNLNENDKNEEVPPGSVCIKYDNQLKKIVWIYGDENKNEEVIEEEHPYFVFKRLVDFYKIRKYDHINKWGIDEYDKMFLFQNYDYNYFEKLDEFV